MSLPTRVQADLQAAEALETQFQEQRRAATSPVMTVADLVAQPAPNEPPSEPPQQPVSVEPVAPVAPKDDFEHKYRVLQGMYAADVNASKKQISTLTNQVQALIGEVQAVKERPTQTPANAGADQKDIETFGADLMEMVQRYTERKAAEFDVRLRALEQAVNGVSQRTAMTQEQQFYATLDTLVPAWKEINVDPQWLAWLAEVDPVYGAPRQAALDAAHERQDASRVANVFKSYQASLPPKPTPGSLANQVAPSGAASVAPTPTPPKPILSESAITAFYNDFGRGRYAGREAEAAALEAQINAAVAEGRVR